MHLTHEKFGSRFAKIFRGFSWPQSHAIEFCAVRRAAGVDIVRGALGRAGDDNWQAQIVKRAAAQIAIGLHDIAVAACGRPIHADAVAIDFHHARYLKHGRGTQRVGAGKQFGAVALAIAVSI